MSQQANHIIIRLTVTDSHSQVSYQLLPTTAELILSSAVLASQLAYYNTVGRQDDVRIIDFPTNFNHLAELYLACKSLLEGHCRLTDQITGQATGQATGQVVGLLQLAHFLEDNQLFDDLMIDVVACYQSRYQADISQLNYDVRWEVYLRLPYCFSPFTDDSDRWVFFESWLKRNSELVIIVDGHSYLSKIIHVISKASYLNAEVDSVTSFVTYKDDQKHGASWQWLDCEADMVGCQISNNHCHCHNYRHRRLVCQCYYDANLPNGTLSEWDSQGQLRTTTHYQMNERCGQKVEFTASGDKFKVSHYRQGKLHGLTTIYCQKPSPTTNGSGGTKLLTVASDSSLLTDLSRYIGYNTQTNFSRCEINYVDDKRQGLAQTWDWSDRLQMQVHYKDNKLDGLKRTWYRSGYLSSETNYKDGQIADASYCWYDCDHDHNHDHDCDANKELNSQGQSDKNQVDPEQLLTAGLSSYQYYIDDKLSAFAFSWYPLKRTGNDDYNSNSSSSNSGNTRSNQKSAARVKHGGLKSCCHYIDGKKEGECCEWYDNPDNNCSVFKLDKNETVIAKLEMRHQLDYVSRFIKSLSQQMALLKQQFGSYRTHFIDSDDDDDDDDSADSGSNDSRSSNTNSSSSHKVNVVDSQASVTQPATVVTDRNTTVDLGSLKCLIFNMNVQQQKSSCNYHHGLRHGLVQEWWSTEEVLAATNNDNSIIAKPVLKLEQNFTTVKGSGKSKLRSIRQGDFRGWQANGQLLFHVRYQDNLKVAKIVGDSNDE